MVSAPPGINHCSSVIQNEEPLLWTCPGIESIPRVDSHQPQNAQVLIASSNSEYQIVPHRTLIQGSQGAASPVCNWKYTVVQPQTNSDIQHQPQPVTHELDPLAELQQASNQQPQITVIEQRGQQSAPHQLQSSGFHQQPSSQTAMSVGHQHESRVPGQAVQQLSIIQQPNNNVQPVVTSQHLTLGRQSSNSQSQPHQQMPLIIIHQQVTQAVNVAQHITQPQLQGNPETSSPQEQLPHSQRSNLQPPMGKIFFY